MKTLLWGVVLAAAAATLGWLLHETEGAVIALAPPWRIDVSLDLVLLLSLIALWLAYLAGRLVQRAKDFPERVQAYRERRSDWGAQRGLVVALKALLEGRFARAERAAERVQGYPQIAGLAALLGARAAHRLQEYDRRDQWLERAAVDAELAAARRVMSAELWAEQRENQRVLQAIAPLQQSGARHIHLQRLALAAHLQLGHWGDALRIVRALEKHRGLPAPACAAYKAMAYRGLLQEADRPDLFSQAWSTIPQRDRPAPDLALVAARTFNGFGMGAEAARVIEDGLEAGWNESLLDEYARSALADGRSALARAERWLALQGPSAALLRCLGRICLREQLWGKAREYLEDSWRLAPAPETAMALGELAEAVPGSVSDPASGFVPGAFPGSSPDSSSGSSSGSSPEIAARYYRAAARGFAERLGAGSATGSGSGAGVGTGPGNERLVRREASL